MIKEVKEARPIKIELPERKGVVGLRRCDDTSFCKDRAISIPIMLKGRVLSSLAGARLSLPEIYAALTVLTGPSGELFDDWKGAYAFPFKVSVRRGDDEYRYALKLTNVRSMVELNLYRLERAGEKHEKDVYHAPFDEELSESDMKYVASYLRGFLLGFLETMPEWPVPFVMEVQSNLILFGYDPDSKEFSQHQYDDDEQYAEALNSWRARIPQKTTAERLEELDW